MKKNVLKKLHRKYLSYMYGMNKNVDLEKIDQMDIYDIYIANAI